jgi:hypothetical protein
MPAKRKSSGKGRVTGAKRQELNESRSSKILETDSKEHSFARVVKHLGMGRVSAMVSGPRGSPTQIVVQIPKLFGRKGATPITSSSVVTIYVGLGFNPETDYDPKTHFQVTSILTEKQAYELKEEGRIPEWMTTVDKAAEDAGTKEEAFEFDRLGTATEEEDEEGEEGKEGKEDSEEETNKIQFSRKAAKDAVMDDFWDI